MKKEKYENQRNFYVNPYLIKDGLGMVITACYKAIELMPYIGSTDIIYRRPLYNAYRYFAGQVRHSSRSRAE